jgi:hypothetical protein
MLEALLSATQDIVTTTVSKIASQAKDATRVLIAGWKWFPEVHHRCPGVPCLIVGTHADLRDERSVSPFSSRHRHKRTSPPDLNGVYPRSHSNNASVVGSNTSRGSDEVIKSAKITVLGLAE